MFRRESGVFIAFEGGEGSGKSTVASEIFTRIQSHYPNVYLNREPGSTELGEKVRSLLLNSPPASVSHRAELFLFLAARAQALSQTIYPCLSRGDIVITDRFHGSTLAYQGGGRGLDTKRIRDLCDFCSEGLWPHLTLFLDVDPQIGLKRTRKCSEQDRIDGEDLQFHQRVRESYLQMVLDERHHYVRINAEKPLENVIEECWKFVRALLLQHPLYCKELKSKRPIRDKAPDGNYIVP